MNASLIFVGPNRRVTPLEVESSRAGFKPIQVSAFDFDDPYTAGKIKLFLEDTDQALFRFIYPFYDINYRRQVSSLVKSGEDMSTASFKIFEEMIRGWQEFIGSLGMKTVEVNPLETMLQQRNKSFQYETMGPEGLIPPTIHLTSETPIERIEDMLRNTPGVVYKPVSGSQSKGIFIVRQGPDGYSVISDIKGDRPVNQVGDLSDLTRKLHHEGYVAQELIDYADLFGGNDYDLRVHVLDGEVIGTAAFVYNRHTGEEEVHSIDAKAQEDPRLQATMEEARRMSLRAAELFGLYDTGVDLMVSTDYKPLITEVNCFPGWYMLQVNPDLDIAQKEVELYQRLLK